MFTFFNENDLISQNQSGTKLGESWINQLLSITHEICKPFDDDWEVRSIFLDRANAFDKVWYEGLLLKTYWNIR